MRFVDTADYFKDRACMLSFGRLQGAKADAPAKQNRPQYSKQPCSDIAIGHI